MDLLSDLLRRPAISWWDLLDIALVSLLLYELLLLIRGTRAVQMALGGSFLLGLYFVSRWLQLETVNWVIRNLAAYVVFAIIVLFQADLRRALAHFGRAPFFRYFERASSTDETVEELVVAATLTYDLLASIFQPSAPLHDGAVIVQGDRVAAAACFLPLSVNPRVSRELGTRHRAALGVTEESDAVAIVVSEETGIVSLAVGEELERGLSADALRARLRSLVGGASRPEPAPVRSAEL